MIYLLFIFVIIYSYGTRKHVFLVNRTNSMYLECVQTINCLRTCIYLTISNQLLGYKRMTSTLLLFIKHLGTYLLLNYLRFHHFTQRFLRHIQYFTISLRRSRVSRQFKYSSSFHKPFPCCSSRSNFYGNPILLLNSHQSLKMYRLQQ